jgi:hypothetical protein
VSIASLIFSIFSSAKKNDKELFLKLGIISEKLDNLSKNFEHQNEKFPEIFSRLNKIEQDTVLQTEQIKDLKAAVHHRREND